jgi:hypothetical protein
MSFGGPQRFDKPSGSPRTEGGFLPPAFAGIRESQGRWEDQDGENSFSRIFFFPDDIVRVLLPARERQVERSRRSGVPGSITKVFPIVVNLGDRNHHSGTLALISAHGGNQPEDFAG